MAIDLTLESATVAGGSGANITISRPTNTADDDFLIGAVHAEDDVTITPPSGWTLITAFDSPDQAMTTHVFYKRALSEPTSWTWTFSSTYRAGWVKRLTGVVASGDPEDATLSTNSGNSGSTATWIGITTATDGAAVLGFGGHWQDGGQSWSASTDTERIDNGMMFLQADVQASAGASGNKTATYVQGTQWIAILIALKPAVDGVIVLPEVRQTGLFVEPFSMPVTRFVQIIEPLPVVLTFNMVATGDQLVSNVVNELDAASPLWSSVDDDIDSPDDADFINNAIAPGTVQYRAFITDPPEEFGVAVSATIRVRLRGFNFWGQSLTLNARLQGPTVNLSSNVEVMTVSANSVFDTTVPINFTGIDTSAGKPEWEDARVRYEWVL